MLAHLFYQTGSGAVPTPLTQEGEDTVVLYAETYAEESQTRFHAGRTFAVVNRRLGSVAPTPSIVHLFETATRVV